MFRYNFFWIKLFRHFKSKNKNHKLSDSVCLNTSNVLKFASIVWANFWLGKDSRLKVCLPDLDFHACKNWIFAKFIQLLLTNIYYEYCQKISLEQRCIPKQRIVSHVSWVLNLRHVFKAGVNLINLHIDMKQQNLPAKWWNCSPFKNVTIKEVVTASKH